MRNFNNRTENKGKKIFNVRPLDFFRLLKAILMYLAEEQDLKPIPILVADSNSLIQGKHFDDIKKAYIQCIKNKEKIFILI